MQRESVKNDLFDLSAPIVSKLNAGKLGRCKKKSTIFYGQKTGSEHVWRYLMD